MMRLEITEAAKRDIRAIQAFGVKHYGKLQSDKYISGLLDLFDLLERSPLIAPVRLDSKLPLRLHPYLAHVVLYTVRGDTVGILRVVSKRQNWLDFI